MNKNLRSGGILITKKKIDNKIYEKKYYGYKRGDIDVEFLPLDSIQLRDSYLLYNHTKEIALALLKDKVNKDSMQNVGSLKEAFLNPNSVYKLSLRNKKLKVLSKDIGKLKNLRVLDISGSRITEIPPEVENCKKLKSILANASPVSYTHLTLPTNREV